MAQEAHQPTISPAELFKAAEAVAQSGRRRTVQLHGKRLAIVADTPTKAMPPRSRANRGDAFLAASGTLPPLTPPRDINEMTEIAAAEAAQAAARAGLTPDDYS
jgi:hypothetical protein